MSTADVFDPLPSLHVVPRAVAHELEVWMPEYLRAIERQAPPGTLDPKDLANPAKPVVRHGGVWRTNEQTPALIVWPEGVVNIAEDPDGTQLGTVQVGVFIVVSARDEDAVTWLADRFLSGVRSLLLHRAGLGGVTSGLREVDVDLSSIDVQDAGRVRAGMTLSYEAPSVVIGRRFGGPGEHDTPRPDPVPPWPGAPTVETTHLTVTPSFNPLDPN